MIKKTTTRAKQPAVPPYKNPGLSAAGRGFWPQRRIRRLMALSTKSRACRYRLLHLSRVQKINGFYKFNNVRVYEDVTTEDESTFSRVETGKYKQTFYGFSLGIGTQAGRFGNLIFVGRYQFDEITNINNDPVTPYKTKIEDPQ